MPHRGSNPSSQWCGDGFNEVTDKQGDWMTTQSFPMNLGQMPSVDSLPDPFRFFPSAVRILPATSSVMGSGVALSPRWVLTASHLFRLHKSVVRVQSSGEGQTVSVRAIHWRDFSHVLGGNTPWPTQAEALGGDQDQLVLLELDADLHVGMMPAILPDKLAPMVDSQVFIAGYGADEKGNYPVTVRYASLIHRGSCKGRGEAISDKNAKLPNGMARKDDSGAPVFLIQTSPLLIQVLVGIHTSHSVGSQCNLGGIAAQAPVARYIPVDVPAQDWIKSVMGVQKFPVKLPGGNGMPAAMLHAMVAAAAAGETPFCLRGLHACLTLSKPSSLDKVDWAMPEVNGTGTVLRTGDKVRVEFDGVNRWLEIRRCGSNVIRWQIPLTPGGATPEVTHWLQGVFDCPDGDPNIAFRGTSFYVFRRTDGTVNGNACRRLRVEVFLLNSSHTRPSKDVIGNTCPLLDDTAMPTVPVCPPLPVEPLTIPNDDDQDDESDGYED